MDKRNLEATKKSLLEAAEKLMTECSDLSQVTSRAITREAGVNLAMINYCYGSREALLLEVYETMQASAMECNPMFKEMLSGNASPREKLIEVHFQSMKMMLKQYKYAKAVTKYVLLNRDIAAKRGSLAFIMEHFNGKKSEKECRMIAYEISSLHELAVLRHEEIREVCGIDLTDENELRKYVTEHVSMYLDR